MLRETTTDLGTEEITKVVVYTVGHDQISQTTIPYTGGTPGTPTTLVFGHDGHGSVRMLLDMAAAVATLAGVRQIFSFDAYGNAIGFSVALAATTYLYNGEARDTGTGDYNFRDRIYRPDIGVFDRDDRYPGDVWNPQTLHRTLFVHGDPVNLIDPLGLSASLVSTMVTAGIKAGLVSVAVALPFRLYFAAKELDAGASLWDVSLQLSMDIATDFALGAVLGGGTAGIARQIGSNTFKIRAIGQSIGGFKSLRLPSSVWRLADDLRGLAIEKSVLNRAASFLGRQIKSFPVIDDYIVKGGRGIATSIKSLDLTAKSYQTASGLRSKLNQVARELQAFNGTMKHARQFPLGPNTANLIHDKVLVVAFEEGAATSVQANALVQWFRGAAANFPGIKVVVQLVP